MPTPSEITPPLTASALVEDPIVHTLCPPEIIRASAFSVASEERSLSDGDGNVLEEGTVSATIESTATGDNATSLMVETARESSSMKGRESEDDTDMDSPSPANSASDGKDDVSSSPTSQTSSVTSSSSTSSSLSHEFSNVRLVPNHTCSFLRAGSRFEGTQESDHQVYNVHVEIKHVDMAESYLCGYLRIQGLTEEHPTLTTFFEGEIIGTKHTFQTKHESWGANEKTDMQHWARFEAWRPLAKQAKKADFTYRNFAQREHLFMRWKEYFLVPDHRVRQISGASFEGFYYICFNQVEGTVSGIYFHAKSEKYQKLELKHIEDHGCTPAIEFR
ncbi:vesicle-mediated transport protein Vid24, putative [Talaromyces stipitatus ATCC 10500]|uniref:Vesicle-mediated transport protein Vid24, putative n=1 Tax=Talaromyces stipitatus (strain ATCC 10500 / CBS 375.48 / QM 6759 / NRRL 1006) TaxID=441959 RepID=B8LVM8_TALSN|nr:vesicle-mediated transport protein Vid24, putative [Talaromyces stipitatus ATCC 10500]EED24158.1 vesicle-mediated transport protein Vid24, putative [Talaromyces stipitatus ATCC 10500]